MKIEPIAGGCLRVWLTEEEQVQWGLSLSKEGDRRRVGRLIRQVWRQTHQPRCSRLMAEMIPVAEGCLLLLSPTAEPDGCTPKVYRLADGDTLLALARQWARLPVDTQPECCLYEREDGYDLAVYPVVPLTVRQQRLLAEYTDCLGSGEAVVAYWAERGQLLAAGGVLEQITEPAPAAPEGTDALH